MFLLVNKDGKACFIRDNLAFFHLLAVSQGHLNVFKTQSTGYYKLTVDQNKFVWVPVREATSIFTENGRVDL